jgi:serine/threonine-protein kinase
MPLINGESFAGYRILRMIGTGGMGEVYLAAHPRLPRHDVLKVLPAELSANPEFRERFHREADTVAALYHPHIIGVHDRGEHDGRLWISMDHIDGPDAGRLLREHHPHGMPRELVCEIVTAVADALDYAHLRGLLHRDVKPANILLTDPASGVRRILLADFGIARSRADNGLTRTNAVLGTVSYAAPEQLMGRPLDGRADQYSLAATAHELFTGAPLFVDDNPAVVIGQHLNAPPRPLAATRPDLADLDPVMARALAKNPAERFASCSEFAQALRRRGTAVLPVVPNEQDWLLPAATPVARQGGSARWLIAAGVLAVVMLVLGFVLYLRPAGQTGTAPATTTTTTTAPASAVSFENMRDLVYAVYGALPDRPDDAWALFDENYRDKTGYADFRDFWAGVQRVEVLSVSPRDDTSVVARLRYVVRGGRNDTENRWLSVVARDGRLLVKDSERIGPA